MTHFNTTNLQGAALKERKKRADTQEALILDYFRRHVNCKFGPSHIYEHFDRRWPITSIRRAITDLSKPGKDGSLPKLIRTNTKQAGLYRELEYAWQYNFKDTLF